MGTRKSIWCFTVSSELRESTSEDGQDIEYNGKTYKLFLGPVEQPDQSTDYPHQHGYIKCAPQHVVTKGQAISILTSIELYTEGMYVKELESTPSKYHYYCFKSAHSTFTSGERAIKRAMDQIQEIDGNKVTAKRLKATLAKQEGASFVAKNKAVIDVVLQTPECRKDTKSIPTDVNEAENMGNYMEAISNFHTIIKETVEKNGITTTHVAFQESTREDQINAILCIAVLPALARRVRVTDKIPALWFYGRPNCGKSYLFSQIPNYKRVATDAEGVSRFKLDGDQTAYLMDDITPGWLLKPSNNKTLKALCIGERDNVKVFGDTQEVRGFCVFTSNCTPDHLAPLPPSDDTTNREEKEKDHEYDCNAWKRRIIAVKFDIPCEKEPLFIDFEKLSLDLVARKSFQVAYERLESHRLKSLFKVYYDWISDQWSDRDIDLYNSVFKYMTDSNDEIQDV